METEALTIKAVIETAIYVDDLQATEAFYRTILGLKVIAKEPGRHVFFQVGEANVLLAFIAETTLRDERTPMEPEGQDISRLALKLVIWKLCGTNCEQAASPLKMRSHGQRAAGPSTFVTLPGIWLNSSRLECVACRVGGERCPPKPSVLSNLPSNQGVPRIVAGCCCNPASSFMSSCGSTGLTMW